MYTAWMQYTNISTGLREPVYNTSNTRFKSMNTFASWATKIVLIVIIYWKNIMYMYNSKCS